MNYYLINAWFSDLYFSVYICTYFFIISVEEKSEPAQPTVTTTSKMFTLFGKKNKNNQEQAKNEKAEKEEDPYAGFGVEEVWFYFKDH